MRRFEVWAPLLAVLGIMAFAATRSSADVQPVKAEGEGYGTLTDALADHRAGAFSASDSLATADPIDAQDVNGNPTVLVDPTFSTAGATVCVECRLYTSRTATTSTTAGVTTITASSRSRDGASGSYKTDRPATFDTLSFPYYDLRYVDVSAGTIVARARTVGPHPGSAQ